MQYEEENDDLDMVLREHACPICGERSPEKLNWVDETTVVCHTCECRYKL